jgi:hypothetical protein
MMAFTGPQTAQTLNAALTGKPGWLPAMRNHLNRIVICDYSRVKSSLTVGGVRRYTVGIKTLNGQRGVVTILPG